MRMENVHNVKQGNNYKMAFVKLSVGMESQDRQKFVILENKMALGGKIIKINVDVLCSVRNKKGLIVRKMYAIKFLRNKLMLVM